jgi:hypothetical protein
VTDTSEPHWPTWRVMSAYRESRAPSKLGKWNEVQDRIAHTIMVELASGGQPDPRDIAMWSRVTARIHAILMSN